MKPVLCEKCKEEIYKSAFLIFFSVIHETENVFGDAFIKKIRERGAVR